MIESTQICGVRCHFFLTFEGVHRIRSQVILDVMSNSPFVSQANMRQLEGESSS